MSGIIKFSVRSTRTDEAGRLRRVSIRRNMESTREQLTTNEIPLIMASFRGAVIEGSNHFTYTFPLNLS